MVVHKMRSNVDSLPLICRPLLIMNNITIVLTTNIHIETPLFWCLMRDSSDTYPLFNMRPGVSFSYQRNTLRHWTRWTRPYRSPTNIRSKLIWALELLAPTSVPRHIKVLRSTCAIVRCLSHATGRGIGCWYVNLALRPLICCVSYIWRYCI